jgi:ABC-type long-subunit fatty acid transport system fused permease/ATPase subunit
MVDFYRFLNGRQTAPLQSYTKFTHRRKNKTRPAAYRLIEIISILQKCYFRLFFGSFSPLFNIVKILYLYNSC